MSETFEPKPISTTAVPQAIKKAEHYRLLNEPEEAESICLDILEAQPGDQHALTVLILALTDQFTQEGSASAVRRAGEYVMQLEDEYQRHYYRGLVFEREGRTHLSRGKQRGAAYESFRDAMDEYDKAERLRPEGDDSAVLRWNACARAIRRAHLEPPSPEQEREQPLE